ncbi:MAG TPA: SDR family oxidoreductase [Planctomycetota bacterium]|nr:SDR family oxidoreductase [Planctomycetota bacterium]
MTAAGFALITGGSRGIGLAIARMLRARGMALGLVARDAQRLARAAADLGGDVATLAVDLARPDAAEQVLAFVGVRPVDVLVNNAGTAPSDRFERTSDAVVREVLALHVSLPFALIRALLPGMKERGHGTIAQVASTAGLRGFPFTAAYCAGKHALVGMTRALIAELGDVPVRAYALCPGFVDTDLTRGAAAGVAARGRQTADEALAKMAKSNVLGRLQQPDEVAAFLAGLLDAGAPSGVFDLDHDPPLRLP